LSTAREYAVIVHIDFGARDEEGASLMERAEPTKIDVAAIHHIDGSDLRHDQIERCISAIERLGNEVPFGTKPKWLYAPRNLITVLPDLHARYCLPQDTPWPYDALAVTVWSGEIAHEKALGRSEQEKESEYKVKVLVQRSILSALERLEENGISIRVRTADRQAADCYRKVIAFIREHPDDYERGFEQVFVNLVDRLDPPTAT
jgi:hypothetical protein